MVKKKNSKKCKAVKFSTEASREQYANWFHAENVNYDVRQSIFHSIVLPFSFLKSREAV